VPRGRAPGRYAAVVGVAALLALAALLGWVVRPPATGAQAGVIPVAVVIDRDGHVLPIAGLHPETHAGCPPTGAPAGLAHYHPRSGATALALDLTEVPDPDPQGCGFGLIPGGFPNSIAERQVEVPAAVFAAWSARYGETIEADPAAAEADDSGRLSRFLVVFAIALAVGGMLGVAAYRGGPPRRPAPVRSGWGTYGSGGRLDARHAGMFTPPGTPVPAPREDGVPGDGPHSEEPPGAGGAPTLP